VTASPRALIRYSVLGMIGATLTPIQVFLGARLVNQIAQAAPRACRCTTSSHDRGSGSPPRATRARLVRPGTAASCSAARGLEAERRLLAKHRSSTWAISTIPTARRWRAPNATCVAARRPHLVDPRPVGNNRHDLPDGGLLASLHWWAGGSGPRRAVLSLALEPRVTARLYEYYYKGRPKNANGSTSATCWSAGTNKEIRAYVSPIIARPSPDLSEILYAKRSRCFAPAPMSMLTGLVTGRRWRSRISSVASRGVGGSISPGGVVAGDRRLHVGLGHTRQYLEHVRRGGSAHHFFGRLLLVPGDPAAVAGAAEPRPVPAPPIAGSNSTGVTFSIRVARSPLSQG